MSQRSRFFDALATNITLATSAAADDIIDTSGAHNLQVGQRVRFATLTGGAGLSTGVDYFVTADSFGSTTFRVSTTLGGASINFTTDITAGTVSTGDRVYGSDAWAQVFSAIIGDGVVTGGNELAVSENSPTGMSVRVNTGRAFIQGYYFEVFAAQEVMTIGAAHATLPRIDRIVVRRDLANRTATLAVLAGTPAASPSAPALTQSAAGVWEISLAQVAVGAAVVQILNANITDERGARAKGTDIDSILAATGAHAHTGVAGQGTKISWSSLLSVPSTFAPADHDHIGSGGTHGGNIAWTSITGKPSTFAPTDHAHTSAGGGIGGQVSHNSLTSVTADQHHPKNHDHNNADGTNQIQWGNIANIPGSFTPSSHALSSHTGTAADINGWARASAGGGAAGDQVWVGTTDPGGAASEGDVWIKA